MKCPFLTLKWKLTFVKETSLGEKNHDYLKKHLNLLQEKVAYLLCDVLKKETCCLCHGVEIVVSNCVKKPGPRE